MRKGIVTGVIPNKRGQDSFNEYEVNFDNQLIMILYETQLRLFTPACPLTISRPFNYNCAPCVNARHVPLRTHGVAQVAADVVPRLTTARLLQVTGVNVRRHLRPVLLEMFLPGLPCGYHAREDRG